MAVQKWTATELEMMRGVQRRSTVTVLRSIADLIEAGVVDDAVIVAVANNSDDAYGGFIPPTKTKEILAALDMYRGFVVRAAEMTPC